MHYWHKLAGVSMCMPYLVWLCLLLCCFKHECLQLSMLLLHWVNLLAYFPLQLQSWAARHFSSRHKMWSCCWTCGRAVVLHLYLHHITIFEVKLVCHQHPRALKFATDSAQWCLIWSVTESFSKLIFKVSYNEEQNVVLLKWLNLVASDGLAAGWSQCAYL